MISKTTRSYYTLDEVEKNTRLTVLNLPEGSEKIQFLRFGITEGDSVKCLHRLPGGTIVLQKNRQEIAVGFQLAKRIKVIVQPE